MERKNPQSLNCFLNNVDFIHYIPSPVFEGRERVSGSCFLTGHSVPLPAEPAFGPEPQKEHCTHQRLVPYREKLPSQLGVTAFMSVRQMPSSLWCEVWKCVPSQAWQITRLMISRPLWEYLPTFSWFCFGDLVITFVDEEQQNKNLTNPKIRNFPVQHPIKKERENLTSPPARRHYQFPKVLQTARQNAPGEIT